MADATTCSDHQTTDRHSTNDDDMNVLLSALPAQPGWVSRSVKQYQGFWLNEEIIPAIISLQEKFRGRPDHVVLTSYPKSGTTWLKALLFSIANRSPYGSTDASADDGNGNPLVSCNPHGCVPRLELYAAKNMDDPNPDLALVNTHLPYSSLPKSMIDSGCKIVCVVREPKDVMVSFWHFAVLRRCKDLPPLTFDDAFHMFCRGVTEYGPYWDHVLEYWNAHLKFPDKIFLTTYEDLIKRSVYNVKKLADFIGRPFTTVEEQRGLAEEIVSFCSFEKLSNLEVNKTRSTTLPDGLVVKNNTYFRKAQVGDWKNYLTDEMRERIDGITRQKFKGIHLFDPLVSTS